MDLTFHLDTRALGMGLALAAVTLVALWVHARGAAADRRAWDPADDAPERRDRGRLALRAGGLVCLALAAASPALRGRDASREAEPTLVVVLDVSMSMRAADVAPSRLDEAKRQVARGLEAPSGSRVALVAFGGAPTLVCPPTTDRTAFDALLAATGEDAAVPGPSLAAPAVARALALLGEAGGDVVMVSDGEFPDDDRRQLQDVAREAVRRGARVSAIGVGTPGGAAVPVRGATGGPPQVDGQGQPLVSRLDAAVLQWLSQEGGGRYVELQPGGAVDLVALTERLRLAGATVPVHLRPFGPVSLFGYPLALGVLLLAADAWRAWRGGAR